ncbi:TELO2-interacting protein 1 homolog isoform X2 [Ceratina calcarata]|uniref:TELO2-interacting protein 1 homolog isoform X2 n=1 Tax=Ceratina calcarata TaxID=156304 RepID=A0AAJ7NE88_9HYME|nr:TELO2-interacting protein 1 homolog isoform X2 [Ceratina calcarata]
MEPLEIEEAFIKLKPLCDSLITNPNSSNLVKIENALGNVSEKIVRNFFEYISFPLVTHLTKNVREQSVRTMQKLITIAKISKIEHLNRIHSCLLTQICDPKRQTLLIEGNEELKEAVIVCAKTLVDCCHTEVIEAFYSRLAESPAPTIGQHWIMLSLAIAKHERSRSLKIEAIRTLMTLCQVDDESDRSDAILQDQAADVIMFMLPGTLAILQETMTGSDVQSHMITVMALRAWSRIIALMTKDKMEEEEEVNGDNEMLFNNLMQLKDRNEESRIDENDEKELTKHLGSKTRNKGWLYACAIKLNRSFRRLEALSKHPNWKVRFELVEAIRLLLTTCSRNMKPNVMLLTDYLISLSEDESVEVRENAKRSLEAVNVNFDKIDDRPLAELLEENFYDLLTKLPTIIRRSNDADQLSCLNRIAGYLRLLGDQRLHRLMMSVAHVRRLIIALVHVSEIDYADVSILETVNANDLDDSSIVCSGSRSRWKRYRFIDSDACESKVREICRCLAESGDIQILADNITRLLADMPGYTNELILLLNWIVDAPPRDTTRLQVYEDIVDLYVNPDFWYPSVEVDRDVPLRVAQRNVTLCCLLSEGLGMISLNLDRNYERFLLKTLYLVVERAGNKNGLISLVASRTLEMIAKSQHCLSTSDLFNTNMDYLSYNVRIKLRRVHLNPGCLDVIRVLIRHSTIDALSCLREIVEDCSSHSNKNLYRRNSYAFLKVFHVFAACVKDMLAVKGGETIGIEKRADDDDDEENRCSKIVQDVLEYVEAKQVDDRIEEEVEDTECEPQHEEREEEEEEEEEEEQQQQQEEKEKKVEPPFHVTMIEQIARHCLHFVSSKNVDERLIAMSTLQDSLEIMAHWEDELLPIVHSLWHPLVDRFNENDLLIINRAWQLLNTIGDTAKDFIRSRMLKQVWPPLTKFLKDAAKESHMKTTESMYRFTQMYKLQKELLSSFAKLTRNLRLRERETWDVLSVAEPYLNKHQNPVLQDCCVQLYKDIADYNGDIVFVKCLSIFHSKIAKIPTDATLCTKDLIMESSENISRNEYSKNVRTLIKYVQERRFRS